MSDINTVAEAMGIPADLVSRSAAARATAAGSTTEDVLAAWGGGATVASKEPPPVEDPDPDTGVDEPAETPTEPAAQAAPPAEAVPGPPVATAAPPPPPAAPASGEPPILVGSRDNPWAIVAGAVGLFIAVVLLGLVGPSLPVDEPGARSSVLPFTDAALDGAHLYGELGCAGCHTQMVRPVVADVGVGPVTLNDTNQILGTRRFGPDLSNIGNRMSGAQMESSIRGAQGHPTHGLSDEAMSDLIAYLEQSAPAGGES